MNKKLKKVSEGLWDLSQANKHHGPRKKTLFTLTSNGETSVYHDWWVACVNFVLIN